MIGLIKMIGRIDILKPSKETKLIGSMTNAYLCKRSRVRTNEEKIRERFVFGYGKIGASREWIRNFTCIVKEGSMWRESRGTANVRHDFSMQYYGQYG